MDHKTEIIATAIALILITSMSVAAFQMNSTNYAISAITNTCGGVSNSTSYSVTTAVGEPVVGYSSSTHFKLYSGIFHPTASEKECSRNGDFDNNCEINIFDAVRALEYLSGEPSEIHNIDPSDVNNNGLDIFDVFYLIEKISGAV